MREIKAVAETKINLEPYGYKPGSHFFYCGECSRSPNFDHGHWPHQGDSSSTRCITHALQARQTELLILEGQLICEFGRNPIELEIWQHEANFGRTLRALVVSAICAVLAIGGLVAYLT